MTNYKYTFKDGYFCYTCGMMDCASLQNEIRKHGKLMFLQIA